MAQGPSQELLDELEDIRKHLKKMNIIDNSLKEVGKRSDELVVFKDGQQFTVGELRERGVDI